MDRLSKIKRNKFRYFLVLPALVFVFVFSYLPMLGIVIAFQDFDIMKGFLGSPWVGFKNFISIFTIPAFFSAIKNTLLYSSTTLAFGFATPIILALLFNEIKSTTFKRTVQTISYMPYFLSWVSVAAMIYTFFSLEGTVNDIRVQLFGSDTQRVNILMDSKNFLGLMFFSNQWKNIGWSSVIYLAAITGIDPTLYEAAKIDGANRFKQILNITVPGIIPTAIVLLIMSMGNLVTSNFEQVYSLQNLYIQQNTEVINTVVYRQGIMDGKYSLATAFGLSQGLVSFLLVFSANTISKKVGGMSLW